jgi:hypothetical protein
MSNQLEQEAQIDVMPEASLSALPIEIILDHLLPLLPLASIAALSRTSQHFYDLTVSTACTEILLAAGLIHLSETNTFGGRKPCAKPPFPRPRYPSRQRLLAGHRQSTRVFVTLGYLFGVPTRMGGSEEQASGLTNMAGLVIL